MNIKLTLTVLALCSALAACSQYVPFPPTPDGYSIGSSNPILWIEAWLDLACSDCQASYPIIYAALQSYNIKTNPDLKFTAHLFPLPYHRNAFILAQGARIIGDNAVNQQDVWDYFNLIFTNQAQFSGASTYNTTQYDVETNLSYIVSNALPQYNYTFFLNGLSNSTYNSEARVSWKYGCTRGVAGTPTYFANGIMIDGAEDFNNTKNWTDFFDQFFQFSNSSSDSTVLLSDIDAQLVAEEPHIY